MAYRRAIIGVVVLLLLAGFQGQRNEAFAQRSEKDWICKVISVQGRVLVKRQGEAGWQAVGLNDTLSAGDQIRVEANSRAGIVLSNDAVLRLDQNTTLVLTGIEKETTFIFKLIRGAANFFSRRARSLKIFTPFVNGVVEGTEFYVRVDADQTRIDLFEGRILAQNPHGELHLVKGQGAVALAGSAPRRYLLVQPRDSVQWALYYPPVLVLGPEAVPDELKKPLKLYNQGQTLEAVHQLEQFEESVRDTKFFALRAALLLHLGRISQARDNIRQALAADPDHAEALALQAVIAVVQNRKAQALKTAQRAVQANPRSAAAQMALSYAQQAGFDLTGALKTVQAAVKYAPDNGTAWARLAELRLCAGELDQGVQAAQKAAALNPLTAHAHTTLGFAYLTQIKTKKARRAFEQAITLDSAAPLPRLGLGLAKIREGHLVQGRAEIEIAAGLDPLNALIRSYLGKAYFDEKRGPLDGKQLEIAKTLDPGDPTPWFYDAIRKQSLNRPVEALQDLQKSIELNDNRAVYRSRLMLDEDQAARGVSLARIYDDLGFKHRALVESTKSLSIDPTNHSAHRFLSDTYVQLPQRQIAQVSERLQAQLLQPVNVNPVQPSLSLKRLNVVSSVGPGEAAFNEFTPLFERNKLQLTLAGIGGSNNTQGDEVALSGLADRFSYSLGQFHYQTDGFRENSDIEHDIYNAFTQIAITNKINIQFEYRRRETTQGDLQLLLDPDPMGTIQRRDLEHDIWRTGLHLSPLPGSDVIASLIYSDRREGLFKEDPDVRVTDVSDDRAGYNAEAQYLFQENGFNFILGGGVYRFDVDYERTINVEPITITLPPPFPPATIPGSITTDEEDYEINGENLYLYMNIRFPARLVWTLGLSYETYERTESSSDVNRVNPKLGLQWDITDKLRFRTVFAENIKRLLAADQTIEPTQVAGFNQFFDDINGTLSKLSGAAIDATLTDRLYAGLEISCRDLSEGSNREERQYRGYLAWTPHADWSFNAEYRFERDILDLEFDLDTISVPLSIRYFGSQGLYAKLGSTFVWQEEKTVFGDRLNDDFVVVDAAVGYRLPKRLGIISLEIGNLLDQEFRFRDAVFKTSDKFNVVQPFLPERTVLAKVILNF